MNPSLGDRAPITERWIVGEKTPGGFSSWLHERTRARQKIPIRGRIALFGAGVVALAVVTFSSLVYLLVEGSLVSAQDTALKSRGDEVYRQLESPRGFRPSPFLLTIDIAKSSEIFGDIILTAPGQVYSRGKVQGADPVWPADLLQSAPFDHGNIVRSEERRV